MVPNKGIGRQQLVWRLNGLGLGARAEQQPGQFVSTKGTWKRRLAALQ